MKATKSKLIKLLSLFMLLSLSLYAESLTDGKGVFKSNKLIEKKVSIQYSNMEAFIVKLKGLKSVTIKVLIDLGNDITFFKYKDSIVAFKGDMYISDIISDTRNNKLYIFSQDRDSEYSYYDITLLNDKGLQIVGYYEAKDIYGNVNFQNLKEIHRGVNYFFKSKGNDKYLYSNIGNKFIINSKNKKGISFSKIKQYFEKIKITDKKESETEVTSVTCGTGGCVIYTQRIGSIEKISANTRRAFYKVEKYIEDKLQNKETMFIYAKCHKSKEYELSFNSSNDYKTIGTEWRYDFTRQNKKIAFDLCKEFSTPKFTNYTIKTTYTNPNKPLIQKGFGRLYRTRLKKALKEKKPEFAGKYIIAQWGCDEGKNECTTGGIIDASTGKATEFPFKYYAHNGNKEIIYKLNSSLIVFAGDFEFKDGQKKDNKVLFYEFKDGEFLFLKASEYKK